MIAAASASEQPASSSVTTANLRNPWNTRPASRVRVRWDASGNTLLDYRENLPDHFFPVVILDASGRVRATYLNWRKDRGKLHYLGCAPKGYHNLTIHVWDQGGGKTAFRSKWPELMNGIAATIRSKPDERWLVITHKADGEGLLKAIPDLAQKLNVPNSENVSFLTWGSEKATNDFVDVPNLILAGTLDPASN